MLIVQITQSVVTTANYGDYIKTIAERQPNYGKNIFFVSLSEVIHNFEPADYGCNGHPSQFGDEKMAKALSSFISANVLN